jgi:hypothetical protein
MHLECPDPEGQPGRLKFWVEKSLAQKPRALGVTLGSEGNTYDFTPPVRPSPNEGGRPHDERQKACEFILSALTEKNKQRATNLCEVFTKNGGAKNTCLARPR